MTRLGVIVLAGVVGSACHLTINESNTNTNNNTSTSPTSPSNPNNPTPNPTPGVGTGTRTPDPAPGTTLPFPSYAAGVVSQVTVPVSLSCTTFGFLDAVVDALRVRDTRWGYACSSSGCGSSSLDKIAYHASAGPEVVGATGNYLVDLIVDVCGAFPRGSFDVSFDPIAGWTNRGRF